MVKAINLLFCLVSTATCVSMTTASAGDRSMLFHNCMHDCEKQNCTNEVKFHESQPPYLRWLQWSCTDECDYTCMWRTVDRLLHDKYDVPQFHGKWPFLRLYGIQEPASVLFSILNGLPHVYMLPKFRQRVSSEAPMYHVVHGYSAVGVNTWFWSAVFHARDKRFTELMDYCCAFSLVLYPFYLLCLRVVGTDNWLKLGTVSTVFMSLYIYHVQYLAQGSFDYSYNMKANVGIGVTNCLGWLLWCFLGRHQQPYVWKAATLSVLLVLLASLELFDFPPYLWTFDAHSLWHAGTVLLPFLLYSFLIDDCQYMMRQQSKQQKISVLDTGDMTATGDTRDDSTGVKQAYGFIRRDNAVIPNTATDSDGLVRARPLHRQRRDLPT